MNNLKLAYTPKEVADFFPMEPLRGPPLPRFFELYWPWYKPPEAVYTCPYCGATFSTQAELAAHIQEAHPGEEIPPSGEILGITWWSEALASWRPYTEPLPAYTYLTHRFRVKNTGASSAAFKVGYTYYSDFAEQWYWNYSPSFNIEAGMEGDVDWSLNTGPGTWTITFYLFAGDGVGGPEGTPGDALDSVTVTIVAV